jgi:hypothetical protein
MHACMHDITRRCALISIDDTICSVHYIHDTVCMVQFGG